MRRHRTGFTLVEMLIVVVVLATLMTIMFRLGNVMSSQDSRTTTVVRLHRLENCLSGYYAAFGSYPPVKLYGWQDIYHKVENGQQTEEKNTTLNWTQVEKACRAQPLECAFPFGTSQRGDVEKLSRRIQERISNPAEFPKYANLGEGFQKGFSIAKATDARSVWDEADWGTVKLFKFGVMAFLLPRYLVMMDADPEFYGSSGGNACKQWISNNDDPCDPFTGTTFDNGWTDVRQISQSARGVNSDGSQIKNSDGTAADGNAQDMARIANIPSQAVCARWMPNLEGICFGSSDSIKLFGVEIFAPHDSIFVLTKAAPEIELCTLNNGGSYYVLDSVTVQDGWNIPFYYYSPAPYQSYVLWSAGDNNRTFPPWMAIDRLSGDERKTAAEWMSDDIRQMNH